jgi:hypothetical protein
MDVKTLKLANEIQSNITVLENKKEELLKVKVALGSHKDLNHVKIVYRTYMQEEKVVEFPKLLPDHRAYNLYMRDHFSVGMMDFIDKQVDVLDKIIAELGDNLRNL